MGKIKNFFARLRSFISSHKKLSLLLLIILIVAAYVLFPKGKTNVLTQSAKMGDVVKTVSVTGTIDAENSANLTFQTAETLSYVGVKLGDSVTKGQLIASLDQMQLQATLRQAQQDFVAAKAASQQYYDNHTNATESDEEKVARTAIDATQNKAYDQMLKAQHDIANSSLYAPIDGIVTRMDAQEAGVNITPLTVFTITDPTSLVFKLEVDQSDVGQVLLGQKVKIVLDSFPNTTLTETVDKIDFVSHTTSSNGTAYYVNSGLPSDQNYRVGMSGNADIIVATKNNVLTIPASSVMDDNTVYKQSGKHFIKTKVKLGLQNDTLSEVTSGLAEGDIVAVDPTSVPANLILKSK